MKSRALENKIIDDGRRLSALVDDIVLNNMVVFNIKKWLFKALDKEIIREYVESEMEPVATLAQSAIDEYGVKLHKEDELMKLITTKKY